MKLNHEKHEQVTVVRLEGDMTVDDVKAFKKLAEDHMAGQTCDFILDMSCLEFIDSQGLETLLWLRDEAGERLGQVRVVEPTENVKQIMHITRLSRYFDTHDTVDIAMKSLR